MAHDVPEVVVLDDGCVKIRYRNDGEKNLRPAVSVYLLNRYGSVLSRIDDVWKIKRLKPGADAVSVPFEGNKDARYIDIEVAE